MRTILTLLIYTLVEAFFVPPGFSATPSLAPAALSLDAAFASVPLFTQADLGDKKIQDLGDTYLISKPRDPLFVQIYEKLPAAGFGRLLRYRGLAESERWVDLEFVYQDEARSFTILDYDSGQFFRITFHGNEAASSCLFPLNDEKGFTKDSGTAPPVSSKWILSSYTVPGWALPEIHRILSDSTGLSKEENWSTRLVRGPPEGVSR